ncbi:MAG: 3-deoxy-8-phosphooctulonate synthase [Planctomycetota bacterium]|nr:3-deoxy-8-phosphooctulonate synthase [Planctomycetota bacterium]
MSAIRSIDAAGTKLGSDRLFLIAGPCVIESVETCVEVAGRLKQVCSEMGIPYVFKASYDKANRSSLRSFRGPGIDEGLKVLQQVKQDVGVPVLSDVHQRDEAASAAEVVDILQIPAFLCRQTDLVVAVGETGKPVNIKKAQFMAPWDLRYVVEKIVSTGNEQILLTERGTSFGYNTLVNDMRAIPILSLLGYPVIFDATHSVQAPGGLGDRSGGERKYAPTLAKAAVAAGCHGVFMEVHPDPDRALSDGPNSITLDSVPALLAQLVKISEVVRGDVSR